MFDIINKLQSKPNFRGQTGAPIELVEQAEKILELKFADEYREYLFAFGIASAHGHELTGICPYPRLNVIDVTIYERKRIPNVSLGFYVVEQANIDGIVVWQSNTGEVFQTAPNMQTMKLCNSLCDYLDL